MIRENRTKTNVVWSFESQCLNSELIEKVQCEQIDALRLVSDGNDIGDLINFIHEVRKAYKAISSRRFASRRYLFH